MAIINKKVYSHTLSSRFGIYKILCHLDIFESDQQPILKYGDSLGKQIPGPAP